MTTMTPEQFAVTAQVILNVFTPEMIRGMHRTAGGAEILRLIVRDDIGGAAETIATALWDNL